jgi:lipopolysaccharide transport system ATP-binding protein
MSSSDVPVISVRNVSKRYHVYENQRVRLRHTLWPSNTRGVTDVWALRDISFDVGRGESVGVIGRNGAGKSTLLQIIARTVTPTSGGLTVTGRVAALLELGSGFNPEYSGRDNVMLNGLLLGLTRAQIEQRFDAIASFADIGDVLHRPVKTYSSGMLIRLAFSVQVALDPDVLILDEALSVGDYFFQQKCFARLRAMRDSGVTLLLVSHDMSTVRDACERVLYLKQGRGVYLGDAQEAARSYLADGCVPAEQEPTIKHGSVALDLDLWQQLAAGALWSCAPDGDGRLLAVHVLDMAGEPTTQAVLGATVVVRVSFRKHGSRLPLLIKVMLKNKYGQLIVSTGSNLLGVEIADGPTQGVATFELELDLMLEAGLYSCKVVCTDQAGLSNAGTRDETGWIGPLRVNWNYEDRQPPFFGMFGLPVRSRGVVARVEADGRERCERAQVGTGQ